MAAAEVKVSGSFYLPWLRVESQMPTRKTECTAMIRVKAPPLSVGSNAPSIHLVVVLDVSVPRYLTKVMEFIKGEFHGNASQDHRVDVVTASGDSITKLMPINDWILQEENNDFICMRKGETTDLKLVLERTLEAVKQRHRQSYENRVGFIILVSDGESKFECDDRGFERELRRYPVHALGLDKNHDPKVLHRIAEVSRGTYSFIPVADMDTDENLINNSKLVMEAMALCLGGLKSVVAIDTRVKISVPDDTTAEDTLIIQDLKIVEIQSGGHESSIDSKGRRKGEISVGVLYAGEVKDFIVRLQFKSDMGNGRTRSSVLTAAVEYYKDISSKQQHLPRKRKQRVVPLLVTSSDDEGAREAYKELEQQAPNSRVMRQMILFRVVQMLLHFANTTTTNNNNNGGNLRDMWDKLRSRGNQKMAKENDLVDLYRNLKMARENDLVDLQGIDEVMGAMASRLDSMEGGLRAGLGCIYSWVSGYQMQRATTTGLSLPALRAPFQTPAMEAAVRNVSHFVLDLQARRLQSAITLLEKLEREFNGRDESHDDHRMIVGKAVIGAIDDRARHRTTASRSDDNKEMPTATNLDDRLKDDIKSTIAIRLFDCFTKLIKEKERRSKDDWDKIYHQIYQDAKVAIKYWSQVQGKIMSDSGSQYQRKTSTSEYYQRTTSIMERSLSLQKTRERSRSPVSPNSPRSSSPVSLMEYYRTNMPTKGKKATEGCSTGSPTSARSCSPVSFGEYYRTKKLTEGKKAMEGCSPVSPSSPRSSSPVSLSEYYRTKMPTKGKKATEGRSTGSPTSARSCSPVSFGEYYRTKKPTEGRKATEGCSSVSPTRARFCFPISPSSPRSSSPVSLSEYYRTKMPTKGKKATEGRSPVSPTSARSCSPVSFSEYYRTKKPTEGKKATEGRSSVSPTKARSCSPVSPSEYYRTKKPT